MARIGGAVEQIVNTATEFTGTGSEAAATGSDTAGFAAEMDGQVNETVAMLRSRTQERAAQLHDTLVRTQNALAGTDWEGQSQSEATAAEESFRSETDRVLADAEAFTAEFETLMRNQAEQYLSQIEGPFNSMMQSAQARYEELSQASNAFASNLEQADQTIKFGG